MLNVTLREAVTKKATVTYEDGSTETVEFEVKHALKARKCAGCDRAYEMHKWPWTYTKTVLVAFLAFCTGPVGLTFAFLFNVVNDDRLHSIR